MLPVHKLRHPAGQRLQHHWRPPGWGATRKMLLVMIMLETMKNHEWWCCQHKDLQGHLFQSLRSTATAWRWWKTTRTGPSARTTSPPWWQCWASPPRTSGWISRPKDWPRRIRPPSLLSHFQRPLLWHSLASSISYPTYYSLLTNFSNFSYEKEIRGVAVFQFPSFSFNVLQRDPKAWMIKRPQSTKGKQGEIKNGIPHPGTSTSTLLAVLQDSNSRFSPVKCEMVLLYYSQSSKHDKSTLVMNKLIIIKSSSS